MNLDDKKKKLLDAQSKLKNDFIGVDNIVDQVIEYVTPWYLTPEILERPTVISLWGLTGTGKTQLVRNLLNYLDLIKTSSFIDCGELANFSGERLLSTDLQNQFKSTEVNAGESEIDTESKLNSSLTACFVFDEFQHLKTIDEESKELDRPESRAIWTLIDSGKIDLSTYSRRLIELQTFYDELRIFSEANPEVKLGNGHFDSSLNVKLKESITEFRWEDVELETGYPILQQEARRFILERLNGSKYKEERINFLTKLTQFTSLDAYLDWLSEFINLASIPRMIDCSKSLIFILGNLDEAFPLNDEDIDPDINADVYNQITSQVNILDVKSALGKRFRDEQVGRLGNNIVIYPSLKEKDFEQIIGKYLDNIASKFKTKHEIDVHFTDNLKRFIYAEGVFPIQGARPIFTTINSFIVPRLSEVLLEKTEECTGAIIDVVETNFERELVTFRIDFKSEQGVSLKLYEKKVKTVLGVTRKLSHSSKLMIQGIHEASHSVVYTMLTGEFPSAIVAGSITGGGYMLKEISFDKSSLGIDEFEIRMLVSLAGYFGERTFFQPNKCTLGSSSDISNAWEDLSYAVLECGYLTPRRYSHSLSTEYRQGSPAGFDWRSSKLDVKMNELMDRFEKQVKDLIEQEKELIKEIGLYLSRERCMSSEVFKDFIVKYANTFTLESLKELKESNINYYNNALKDGRD